MYKDDSKVYIYIHCPESDVADSSWKIQSRSPLAPPHYIGDGAKTFNSIIMSGCEVYGVVENSVLASNVVIKKGAVVKNSILMGDVIVEEDAKIEYSIIDEGTTVGKGAVIGESKENGKGIALLSRNISICDGAIIKGGEIVDKDVVKGDN